MAAAAVVGGDRDRRVGGRHRPPRVGRDERLVAEADDDRRGAELPRGVDPAAQRRQLPVGPTVVDDVHDHGVQRGGELTGGHDHDGADAGGQRRLDGAFDERLPAHARVELVRRAAEAAAGTGREHDCNDGRHGVVSTAAAEAAVPVEFRRHAPSLAAFATVADTPAGVTT